MLINHLVSEIPRCLTWFVLWIVSIRVNLRYSDLVRSLVNHYRSAEDAQLIFEVTAPLEMFTDFGSLTPTSSYDMVYEYIYIYDMVI